MTAAAALQQALEALEEFDHGLSQWAQAYPVDVFPEPDFSKVRRLLGDNLLTCVSAANMRHVATKLDELFAPVRAALASLRAAAVPEALTDAKPVAFVDERSLRWLQDNAGRTGWTTARLYPLGGTGLAPVYASPEVRGAQPAQVDADAKRIDAWAANPLWRLNHYAGKWRMSSPDAVLTDWLPTARDAIDAAMTPSLPAEAGSEQLEKKK